MKKLSGKIAKVVTDPALFAKGQGLRYVSDEEPGFGRKRAGKGFVYVDHRKKTIKKTTIISRIRALVIPPAWQTVWICRDEKGHLQVTGRDARARKQYRYHPDWTRTRNETKFEKLLDFGLALPKIRKTLETHLREPGLSKNKVLAAVVQVMEITRMRVGNDVYSRENDSYGLTTIRNHHAKIKGSKVRFLYRGKSGVERDVSLSDPRLSRIIRACHDLPGEELFGYRDEDGNTHDIGSADVNQYLKEISGQAITAKEFRTWGGTVKAIEILLKLGPLEKSTETARKKREVQIIKEVAAYLGNTVAVCRKYYVSPLVFEADRGGNLYKAHRQLGRASGGFSKDEMLLMKLLK